MNIVKLNNENAVPSALRTILRNAYFLNGAR